MARQEEYILILIAKCVIINAINIIGKEAIMADIPAQTIEKLSNMSSDKRNIIFAIIDQFSENTSSKNTGKRIGAASGKFPHMTQEEFDSCNDEIAAMFYGSDS